MTRSASLVFGLCLICFAKFEKVGDCRARLSTACGAAFEMKQIKVFVRTKSQQVLVLDLRAKNRIVGTSVFVVKPHKGQSFHVNITFG